MNSKRMVWIDLLKILACFLVIINHCIGNIFNFSKEINTTIFYCINFSLCKIAVPIFIMITGALLLNKNSNYRDMLKKILRIIIPLLLLSYIIYIKNNDFNIINFVKSFLKEPVIYPYWYLYMLISLYLVTPFIQKMIANFNNKDFICFILVCLIFPLLFETSFKIFNYSISNMFYICVFSKIIGIYVLGYFLSTCNIKKMYKNISIISFIMLMILYFLTFYIPYIKVGQISYLFDNYDCLFAVIGGACIFYLFRYIFKKENYKYFKIISIVSSCTFGIYLFHYLFINTILRIDIIQLVFKYNLYLGIYLLEIIAFLVSFIITYLLKQIPYIKKVL